MTFPSDDWEEISPCVFRRKSFTPEQLERLKRRPDAMIAAAIGKTAHPTTEHPPHHGGTP